MAQKEKKETKQAGNIAALHLVSSDEKNAAWGKKLYRSYYRNAIGAWYGDSNLYNKIKAYGQGKQDLLQYREQYDPQGAQTTTAGALNKPFDEQRGAQNWNIHSPLPKMKRDIIALILKVALEIEAEAIDKLAVDERNKADLKLRVQAAADKALAEISRAINPNMPPLKSGFSDEILAQPDDAGVGTGFDFTNETERQIAMNLFYRQDVELGAEEVIATLFAITEMEEWRTLLVEDAFDFGRCAGQRFTNNNTCMPDFRMLDLSRLRLLPHKRRDARDSNGWFYQEWFTVNDIVEMMGKEFSREELKTIYEHGIKSYGYGGIITDNKIDNYNFETATANDYGNVRVAAVYFEIATQNAGRSYEKKKGKYNQTKYKKRSFDYQPADKDSTMEHVWKKVWYKGYYFAALDEVKGWKMLENMIQEEGKPQLTRNSLAYYRFDEKSATERAIVHLDAIQHAHMKLQTNVLKSLPPGMSFDTDSLSEVVLGQAGAVTPESIAALYFQTGTMFHKSLDQNGQPIRPSGQDPHMVLPNGLSPEIMRYVEIINYSKQELADTIGWNPLIGGTPPDPRVSAKGTAIAAANAINATHYLQRGFENFFVDTARHFLQMTQVMFEYNTDGAKLLRDMIGLTNSAIIDSLQKLPLHRFDVFLHQDLSEEEEIQFRTDVSIALERNQISFGDYLVLKQIKNVKQAIPLFMLRIDKAAKAAAEAAQGQLQAAAQAQALDVDTKMKLADLDSKTKLQVAQLNNQTVMETTNLKEQGKGVSHQASHQNRLAETEAKKNADKELIQQKALADTLTKI